jgi:anti-anti-sigma factor
VAQRPERTRRPSSRCPAAHPLAYTARTGEAVWLAKRSQLAWQERSFTAAEQVPAVDISVPLVLDDTVTGALGMSFDHGAPDLSPQQRSTILALAGQSAQALERARLHQAEHDIAETLQRSLLPAGIPCLERIEFAAHYLPAADVAQAGGDWYDVLDIGQHTVAIAVGDVVGHGPAAAALMGQLRTALALCLLRGDSPSRALHQLDRFAARIPGARGSSAICLLLDCLSGDVLWASAGHPPALLVTLDGTRFLEDAVPGPVLGLPPTVRAAPYRDHSVTIAPGSTVILYTDGLVERPASPVGHDLRRLAETAGRLAAHGPARAASAILREFADDPSAPDDIALITARFMPAPMRRRRPADPAELAGVRTEVGVWAGQCGLPEDMCQDLQFALGEALANSMEHAYRDTEPGSVEFELARTADGSVAVTVTDLGRWRPPPDDPGHRGRGLSMIGVLADDVDVRHDTAGTTVRFRLPPAPTGEDLPPGQPPAPMPRSDRPTPAAATADQVVLPGHVDLTNVHTLRAELLDAVRPGDDPTPLTLDLRSTTYLASAGVALIIDVVERGETLGRTVAIRVRPGSAVARTLTLSGLDHVTGSGEGGRNPDRITTIQDAAAP